MATRERRRGELRGRWIAACVLLTLLTACRQLPLREPDMPPRMPELPASADATAPSEERATSLPSLPDPLVGSASFTSKSPATDVPLPTPRPPALVSKNTPGIVAEVVPLPPLEASASLAVMSKVLPEVSSKTHAAIDPKTATPLLDAAIERAAELRRSNLEDAEPELPKGWDDGASQSSPAVHANADAKPSARPSPIKSAASNVPESALVATGTPRRIDPASLSPSRSPRDLWREASQTMQRVAIEQTRVPTPETPLWTIRAQWVEALREIETGSSVGHTWRTVMTVLSEPTSSDAKSDERRAAEIRAAVDAIEHRMPLIVDDVRLCEKVDSFGVFETIRPGKLHAGSSLVVYAALSGLTYEPDGDAFRARVTPRVELIRAEGGPAVWAQEINTVEDLCRQRRRDFFLGSVITLPETLKAGDYRLRLRITDEVVGHSVNKTIAVAVGDKPK